MMDNWKLFYVFQDPLGASDSKIGITGSPAVRLGVYQNSYSSRSHLAQFDCVYYGEKKTVEHLEKVMKQLYDWDIERDGRGFSEWIWNNSSTDIVKKIDEVIDGYKFKVYKLPAKFLPTNIENLDEVLEHIEEQ
jgi:hypothetical protein